MKSSKDNQKAALAMGSSLERYEIFLQSQTWHGERH